MGASHLSRASGFHPFAGTSDWSLPNPSCDRSYACECRHTRGIFGRHSSFVRSNARVRARTSGEASKTDGGELVDTRRAQFVEAIGHRLLVADDRGVLGSGEPSRSSIARYDGSWPYIANSSAAWRPRAATSSVTLTGNEAATRTAVVRAAGLGGGLTQRRPDVFGQRLGSGHPRHRPRRAPAASRSICGPSAAMYTSGVGAPGICSAPRVVQSHRPHRRVRRPAAAAGRRGTRASGAPACPTTRPTSVRSPSGGSCRCRG